MIVLTHNLFFFHELLHMRHKIKKQASCFRVRKASWSTVHQLDADKLRNDYEGMWLIVKEREIGMGTVPATANAMRRILETFFTFNSEKRELKDALEALKDDDNNFKPFYRFIDRGSHADADTITDFGDIDLVDYVERFRRIFEKTNFTKHFDHMMA